jgi:hypothetical protein
MKPTVNPSNKTCKLSTVKKQLNVSANANSHLLRIHVLSNGLGISFILILKTQREEVTLR